MTGWLSRVCISMVPDHSPPVEGCQAPLDGVVVSCLHMAAQPDEVVVSCLYKYGAGPFPSCGGVAGEARRGVVSCLYKYGAGPFPSCGGVAGEARRGGVLRTHQTHDNR